MLAKYTIYDYEHNVAILSRHINLKNVVASALCHCGEVEATNPLLTCIRMR